jgi:IS1 family transposase
MNTREGFSTQIKHRYAQIKCRYKILSVKICKICVICVLKNERRRLTTTSSYYGLLRCVRNGKYPFIAESAAIKQPITWIQTCSIVRDCFGRSSLAMTSAWGMTSARVMTSECLTMNSLFPSLRGTKQSRIMKQEETYNDEGSTTLTGVLDCFGRASLAMTRAWGMTSERLFAGILDCFGRTSLAMTNARVMTSECLTMNSLFPSLRGTKQSRMMKQEGTYNNEGRRSLCASILDCFGRASLAMTRARGMTSEGLRTRDTFTS